MPRVAYKPLSNAIYQRDHKTLASTARADPDAAQHWKPIMDAAFVGDAQSIDILVEHGADVNISAGTGAKHNPLTRLCQFHRTIPKHDGHRKALDKLLGYGADPRKSAGPLELAPLAYAAMGPLRELMEPLIEATQPMDILTAALLADRKQIKRLAGKGGSAAKDATGRTALHYLALSGVTKKADPVDAQSCVKVLLDSGFEIDAVQPIPEGDSVFEATPLWYAVSWQGNIPLTSYLLENGAKPDVAVFSSLFHGDVKICELLDEYGADWNIRVEGLTPLMDLMKWNRTKLLPWLLERDVDVNAKDDEGKTALDYAHKRKIRKDVIELLKQHGAVTS